jgi:hypothetical protein
MISQRVGLRANCRLGSGAGCPNAAVCGAGIQQLKEVTAHSISYLRDPRARIRILFYFISSLTEHLNSLILPMVANHTFPIISFPVCLNHGYNSRSLQPQQGKPHYNAEPLYNTAGKPSLNSQIRTSDSKVQPLTNPNLKP